MACPIESLRVPAHGVQGFGKLVLLTAPTPSLSPQARLDIPAFVQRLAPWPEPATPAPEEISSPTPWQTARTERARHRESALAGLPTSMGYSLHKVWQSPHSSAIRQRATEHTLWIAKHRTVSWSHIQLAHHDNPGIWNYGFNPLWTANTTNRRTAGRQPPVVAASISTSADATKTRRVTHRHPP